MSNILPQLRAARRAGTPLVGIACSSPPDTIRTLREQTFREYPVLGWDIQRGLFGCDEIAKSYLTQALDEDMLPETRNPGFALEVLRRVPPPDQTAILMDNGHRLLEDLTVVQGLLNLRDPFKRRQCTVVLVGRHFILPSELVFQMATFEEDLPTDAELSKTILSIYSDAEVPEPTPEKHQQEIEACRGLALYAAEDGAARCMTLEGIVVDELWEFKRRIVRQTQGLEISREGHTYADVGGIQQIKGFFRHLFANSEDAPAAVIHIDEIDKALGGSHSADAHAVEKDTLGTLLKAMEDNEWTGIIAVGAAGCAKSLIAKATGCEFGRPTIQMDLGAMKGGIIGTTEANNRAAIQVIKGVAGKKAYFIATANRLESLPPELQRRFTDGIWFFDLPNDEEREQIWRINLHKYELDPHQERPRTANYTGSDIRNICRNAKRMRIPVTEAVQYIVPVEHQSKDAITRLRELAENSRFLSASYPGHYQRNREEPSTGSAGRKMQVS